MAHRGGIDGFRTYLLAGGAAPGTVEVRLSYLKRLQRASGPLLTLQRQQLLEFLACQTWAPETRRCARSSLRVFYAWAQAEELRPDDPAARLPKVRVPIATPRPAPDPIYAAAIAAATVRVALMLMLAWYAGLRRGEICKVHTSDIDGDTLYVRGKGGRSRLVPLCPELMRALATWPTGWLFPGGVGGHLSPHWTGKLMRRYLTGAYVPHTLRHAAATRWLARTGNLLVVRELLGHASVATTQRYTLVPTDAMRAAVLGS